MELPKLHVSIGKKIVLVPAHPTAHRLIPLSNLDYYSPEMITIFHIYHTSQSHPTTADPSTTLSNSLAEALVYFYPLAGRVRQNGKQSKLEIQCYEEGCVFIEAYAHHDLKDIGEWNDWKGGSSWDQLLPDYKNYPGSQKDGIIEAPLLFVQVTRFKTGGFTMGMSINHYVVDGVATSEFLECWANIARGITKVNPSSFRFDRSWLAPRSPPNPRLAQMGCMQLPDISNLKCKWEEGEFEYDFFPFALQKLKKLRQIVDQSSGELPHKCTNFEVLAAYIWQARTRALNLEGSHQVRLFFAIHGIAHMKHLGNQTKKYVGNMVLYPSIIRRADELIQSSLSSVVKLVQQAKESVTEEYIEAAIDHFEITHTAPTATTDPATFFLIQWTCLKLHDKTDFGWGSPAYVGPPRNPPSFRDQCGYILSDGPTRQGNRCHYLLLGLPKYAMKSFKTYANFYHSCL